MISRKKGRFISVEGGEGVGKSYFIQALRKELDAHLGYAVRVTREPGGTPIAEKIREIFISPPQGEALDIRTEFLLISASRAQHVKEIIFPSINSGHWVLCDRFIDSSRVYQGMIGGLRDDALEQVASFSAQGLEPDVTFLLDCDVETALARIQKRAKELGATANRFDCEQKEFHEKVRAGFLTLTKKFPERFFILNAELQIEELIEKSMAFIKTRLMY